jgi:hypothetical protein
MTPEDLQKLLRKTDRTILFARIVMVIVPLLLLAVLFGLVAYTWC